ncbi:MAG: hypothetical protein IJ237_05930 [Oscillospiraceae bacterium]|nr:hypothetical protein [Oscillospiraceae bacterium]
MKYFNSSIRAALINLGVKHWQLAQALGIDESTLCRRMRKQFSEKDTAYCLTLIEKIAHEERENNV